MLVDIHTFNFSLHALPALIKIYQRILTVGGNIVNYDWPILWLYLIEQSDIYIHET